MKSQQKSPEPDGNVAVCEEGSVATAEDPAAIATIQSAATFSDQPIKYVFKTEGTGGQVTYRVIQVSDGQLEGQTDGAAAVSLVTGFPAAGQTVTQAVFSQTDGLEGDGGAEAQYAYYPATIAEATSGTMVTTVQASDTLLGQTTPTGQVYVMMSPQEVLTGSSQRSIAPRTQPYIAKQEAPRGSRDEKRRAQHNEVERRRRDKINNWIVQLSKTIPDCNIDYTKTGQVSPDRWGGPGPAEAVLPSRPLSLSEQRRNPVQGLRVHQGAAPEQPEAGGGRGRPGPGPDRQPAAQAGDRRLEVQEPDPEEPAASARDRGLVQHRAPVTEPA
ncbi:upstream stimulatory factor 1 isoform X1 [Takifugu rubripes]|uniref:upstream stimulatory factor 1 isoform X1 n=1 Tax=Takifugu rubripes TaxID=31033 RepID=UPI00114568D7|nr:upstream stimulatory factor 1 isoform X1 [Takifugu rubripes]XP_011607091.2 upstream stimulatory factor 1 isoform X1 [Takifugu rubripes]XP_029699854.1 upstream stimulatory factor 1 isoform X1 [Takifugu rubripes]